MKKLLLSLVVLCVAGTASFAQLSGGLKAGVNLASQKWEAGSESETYNGTSFHVGGYLNFAAGDAFSIQPELLYNSLKISDSGDDITQNFLSIPVMFLYGFADNKFNIQAGPQLGLLLSTDPSEFKSEDALKGTDFSFNFGAGGNFGKFNVTARYCLGLSNMNDKLGDLVGISDLSVKNSNIQLSVGFKLFGE